ncbi:MAG TPA: helicase C-terminal domain-containing protein [Opitutaceae bacterium]
MIGIRDETAPSPTPPSRSPELTAKVFSETGWLEASLSLEHRPGQERMAHAVAAAFRDDKPLLFEAGTGIGKSLAYLVPGIIHATDCGRQMIVSTHTISLQEQIDTKDLPLCRSLFNSVPELAPYAGFVSTVLVGKSNYLCTSRLSHALADRATLFDDAGYNELLRIAAWADKTETGLRHDLQPPPNPEVWDSVNADSSSCSRRNCDCNRCFYQRARARVRSAQVIVVNHALLFSLINAGGPRAEGATIDVSGVLFPGDFVVLDEAHTVAEVAEDSFGLGLSSMGIERTLKHLYNPRTRRGVLSKRGDAEFRQRVADALDACGQFFGFIGTTLLSERAIVRLREAGAAEPLLGEPLAALERSVSKIADALEDGRERDEALEQRARIRAIRAGIDEWLNLSDEGHVYWGEKGGRKQTIVTLRSAPVDVAPELERCLFGSGVSVVCTSATLALGGEIARFAATIGALSARMDVAESPFDFERNMRVFVAADVPPPSATDSRSSIDALSDYVGYCCGRVAGGSLVLFTSYRDMQAVAAVVAPQMADQRRPFLIQGGDISRTELAQRMREAGNAVLFGTDSFWTGVDVPGDALSQVIIVRLPFSPPTHPVAEAKAELIRVRGGDPFNELTLPEALIKFRQGVGRLIRTKADKGLITVLDSRILAKSYGRMFIAGLPQREFARLTRENRDVQFRPFT